MVEVDLFNVDETPEEIGVDGNILQKLKSDQEKLKYLCKLFFSEDELKNSSRTGKRSIKSGETPRPPLNIEKLKTAVLKYCVTFNSDIFMKKFENFQKVLRR